MASIVDGGDVFGDGDIGQAAEDLAGVAALSYADAGFRPDLVADLFFVRTMGGLRLQRYPPWRCDCSVLLPAVRRNRLGRRRRGAPDAPP